MTGTTDNYSKKAIGLSGRSPDKPRVRSHGYYPSQIPDNFALVAASVRCQFSSESNQHGVVQAVSVASVVSLYVRSH